MTVTEHPEKQLLSERQSTALAEVLARWPPGEPGAPASQPARETVVLADLRPPVVRPPYQRPLPLQITDDDDERYGDSLLGAAGAWACVAITVLLMVALTARQLWLWWT